MSSLSARFGMVAGTLITIAVMLAFLAPPITAEKMEGVLVDYRYFLRGDVQPPASVVLITIDALRADRLGIYGHDRPTSPAIDAFFGEGLIFERSRPGRDGHEGLLRRDGRHVR